MGAVCGWDGGTAEAGEEVVSGEGIGGLTDRMLRSLRGELRSSYGRTAGVGGPGGGDLGPRGEDWEGTHST